MRLSIFLFCFVTYQGFAQDTEWTLQKSQNGIDVYTRHSPESKYKSIRAITTFTNNLADIVHVITDADTHYEWINNCTASKLLKSLGDSMIIFYEYYYLPWPASDRDVIIETKIKYNANKTSVLLASKGNPDYIPEKDGVVRIPEFSGSWKLELQSNGLVKGEYIAMINPGGYLPAWLVNMFTINGPYDSFINMKKRLGSK